MNLNPINKIPSFLPYLGDKEIREAFDKFIRQLHRDGEEVGFEMSSPTEDALKELERLMGEKDEKPSSVSRTIAEADMGDTDDEE